MSGPGRPYWILNGKLKPAYVGLGSAPRLASYVRFLTGARGLLEQAAVSTLPRLGVRPPLGKHDAAAAGRRIQDALPPASGALLYNG